MRFVKLSVASLVFLAISAFTLLPFPRPGVLGQYSPITKTRWCTTHDSCLHEIGHELDDRAGQVSRSKAYIDAIDVYMIVQTSHSPDGSWDPNQSKPFNIFAIFYDRDHPDYRLLSELYATMFAQADGQEANIPAAFRPFYDWPLAERLTQPYR